MKKYYLHNGTDQHGPYDIEEIKAKGISKETPIWYEGLADWTIAEAIDELKDLFQINFPPPYNPKLPESLPFQKKQIEPTTHAQLPKKSKSKRTAFIIVFFIIVVGLILINQHHNTTASEKSSADSYQEKVMTVEEIEHSQPNNFLIATGNYNENFLGDKLKVHGTITNNATVATYKDAIVKITYYSKTKTALGNKEYTIYEVFPPHSSIHFKLKIDNYKEVASIGWEVITATPN